MDAAEVEWALLEGKLHAIVEHIEELYGGKYELSFTIEKVMAGEMG